MDLRARAGITSTSPQILMGRTIITSQLVQGTCQAPSKVGGDCKCMGINVNSLYFLPSFAIIRRCSKEIKVVNFFFFFRVTGGSIGIGLAHTVSHCAQYTRHGSSLSASHLLHSSLGSLSFGSLQTPRPPKSMPLLVG